MNSDDRSVTMVNRQSQHQHCGEQWRSVTIADINIHIYTLVTVWPVSLSVHDPATRGLQHTTDPQHPLTAHYRPTTPADSTLQTHNTRWQHTTDPQHPLSTVLHFAANGPFGMHWAERDGRLVSDWPFKLNNNFRLPVHAGKKVYVYSAELCRVDVTWLN